MINFESESEAEACCSDDNLLTCQNALVDPQILETKEDIMLADVVVSFKSTVAPNGFVYQSPVGDEAVITFNEDTGNMFGSFKTTSGRSFSFSFSFRIFYSVSNIQRQVLCH